VSDVHADYLAAIEPVRAGLLGLIEGVDARRISRGGEPESLSPAEMDMREQPTFAVGDGTPVLNARGLGGLQLYAAEEHFKATCRLLAMREPVVFSDRVLVRAGLEAAARSLWLLDWRIDVRTRVARGFTERLYGLFEEQGLAGNEKRADYIQKRDAMLADAAAVGLRCSGSQRRGAHFVEAQRPSATAALRSLLDVAGNSDALGLGGTAQKYLSMFVHSTIPGLLSAGDRATVRPGVNGAAEIAMMSSSSTVNGLLALSATGYMVAASSFLQYMGWSDDAWTKEAQNMGRLLRHVFPSAA
jgi:hypothetical protein